MPNQIKNTPVLSECYRLSEAELVNPSSRHLRARTELGATNAFATEAELLRYVDLLADMQRGEPVIPSDRRFVTACEAALSAKGFSAIATPEPGLSADGPMADLQVKREGLLASMKATLAAIDSRAAELAAVRRPLGEILDARQGWLRLIAINSANREQYVARDAEFRVLLDEAMRAYMGACELHTLYSTWPDKASAARAIADIDQWIDRIRSVVADLEAKAIAYAAEHADAVIDMLPTELRGRIQQAAS